MTSMLVTNVDDSFMCLYFKKNLFSRLKYCNEFAMKEGILAALKLKPTCYFSTFEHFEFQRVVIMNVYGCMTQFGIHKSADRINE